MALIRVYPGDRKTMWERVPNACVSAARQTTRLGAWMTLVLRLLQIPTPGQPRNSDSISAQMAVLRAAVREWPTDPASAERRALRLLTEETAAIVAEAMAMWDEEKKLRRRS